VTQFGGLVAYIAGPGRSGSTLLDLLLNNSPQVQSVGEVHRLNLYARTNMEPCTCGRPVLDCPFWRAVGETLERELCPAVQRPALRTLDMMLVPQDVGRWAALVQKALLVAGARRLHNLLAPWLVPAHARAVRNSFLWYEAIRRVSGAHVIVDSTKDPRRAKSLYFAQPQRLRVLYMIRDGRAVTASAIRREGIDMRTAARRWVSAHRRARWALRGIPAGRIHRVRYETLCLRPHETLRQTCAFLGVDFHDDMVCLRKHESHNIGGNPMRFRTDEMRIRLDERWRGELTPEQLRDFDNIAGRVNRRLGYGD